MQTKKWYQSKTIWGIIVAALGYAMTLIGVEQVSLPENADFEQLKAYAESVKAAQGNWSAVKPYPLELALKKIPYAEQEAFYLGFDTPSLTSSSNADW